MEHYCIPFLNSDPGGSGFVMESVLVRSVAGNVVLKLIFYAKRFQKWQGMHQLAFDIHVVYF